MQPLQPTTGPRSSLLGAAVCLLLAAGCGQSEGGRCQINSDCASGLVCFDSTTGNGICRPAGTAGTGTGTNTGTTTTSGTSTATSTTTPTSAHDAGAVDAAEAEEAAAGAGVDAGSEEAGSASVEAGGEVAGAAVDGDLVDASEG